MMEINKLLGYWTCEQGGKAEVRQTKKKGRHFYTRCDCCGLNQGTGVKRQQSIYDNAEFLPGETIIRPSGVEEKTGFINPVEDKKLDAEKVELLEKDFDPSEKVEDETAPAENNSPGFKRFLPAVILLAAAGVGAWIS